MILNKNLNVWIENLNLKKVSKNPIFNNPVYRKFFEHTVDIEEDDIRVGESGPLFVLYALLKNYEFKSYRLHALLHLGLSLYDRLDEMNRDALGYLIAADILLDELGVSVTPKLLQRVTYGSRYEAPIELSDDFETNIHKVLKDLYVLTGQDEGTSYKEFVNSLNVHDPETLAKLFILEGCLRHVVFYFTCSELLNSNELELFKKGPEIKSISETFSLDLEFGEKTLKGQIKKLFKEQIWFRPWLGLVSVLV